MDTSQLAILRELAERGSITDVALATHKSPSAVSQQLKTLQRSVGVVLVERAGRGVRLTEAGLALAASSVKIATAMAEAEATWNAFRGGETGSVRVAIFPSAAELLVPGLLTRMAAHPAIELQLDDRDVSQDEFAALAADYDIVVSHRSENAFTPGYEALEVVELLREPLDVAIPLGHPLAARSRIALDEIIGENWVSVPTGFPFDRVLMSMATQAGVAPRVVYRATHLPLIENLVTAGHGVALLPRYTSRERAENRFQLVDLVGVRAARHIEALMRPERAARLAVKRVLTELSAEAADVTER